MKYSRNLCPYAFFWQVSPPVREGISGSTRTAGAEGKGYRLYYNGNKYVGQWKNGRRHGYGVFILGHKSPWAGNKYAGEWVDDKRQGKGTYTFADGTEYVGEWNNDLMQGYGEMTYFDGSVYRGQWHAGWKTEGEYVLGQGSRWVG